MPEETVALVDPEGRVVGSAPRSRMRRENLRHLSTGILLRDRSRRIYVTRRSPDKDWFPSAHDAAAGGVVRYGEDVEESARRELAEELGVVDVPLTPLVVGAYEDDTIRSVAHVYEAVLDTEGRTVSHPDGEVVWGAWLTLAELGRRLGDPDWRFVPDTRYLLRRLCEDRVNDYADLAIAGPQAFERMA